MSLSTTGVKMAQQAKTGGYIGIPYDELDCQGFVERVLKDCGVRKTNGTVYNWRGSNSMFRNYIKWRGTIAECIETFGHIPQGAFMFLVKNDGGEVEKGYHDGLGNASHVGLYVDGADFECMDSQRDKGHRPNAGVAYCKLNVFTHVGLMSMIEYDIDKTQQDKDNTDEKSNSINPDKILSIVDNLRQLAGELERMIIL